MQYQIKNLFIAKRRKTFSRPCPREEIYEMIPQFVEKKEIKSTCLRSVVKGKLTEMDFNLSGRPYIDKSSIELIPHTLLTADEVASGEISFDRIIEIETTLNQKTLEKGKELVK